MRSRDKREGRHSEQPSLLFNDTMNDRPLPKPPNTNMNLPSHDIRRGRNRDMRDTRQETGRVNRSYYDESNISYYNENETHTSNTHKLSSHSKSLAEILEDGMRKMNFKMDEVGIKVDGLARRIAKVEQKVEEISQKVNITS